MSTKPTGCRASVLDCGSPCCTSHASAGGEQRTSGSPSPPLEERVGERSSLLDAAVRVILPTGCRTNRSGVLPENNGLLSLPLSSKGGEGNGAVSSVHRDACKQQVPAEHQGLPNAPGQTGRLRLPRQKQPRLIPYTTIGWPSRRRASFARAPEKARARHGHRQS